MTGNRRGAGQALVEFALVLPLILLIIVLFLEFGRIIYIHTTLNNAVREGARFAVVQQFPSAAQRELDIRARVVGYAIGYLLDTDDVSVYCDQNPADVINPCDEYVTVSAQVEIAPMVGVIAWVIENGSTFNVTAQSTMQMTPYGNQ